MQVISVTEGRKNLGELMDRVRFQQSIVVLGKHGKPEAMLISFPGEGSDFSVTKVNAASPSFAFLAEEPDLYSRDDLIESYA